MIPSVEEATALLSDFAKQRKWGSLEFEFRAGDLVFIRKNETLVPTNVKNSSGLKEHNGPDDRRFTKNSQ